MKILAVALWANRTHGDRAPVWIAEQIGTLALKGDSAGVAKWTAIAAAWEHLRMSSLQ